MKTDPRYLRWFNQSVDWHNVFGDWDSQSAWHTLIEQTAREAGDL